MQWESSKILSKGYNKLNCYMKVTTTVTRKKSSFINGYKRLQELSTSYILNDFYDNNI